MRNCISSSSVSNTITRGIMNSNCERQVKMDRRAVSQISDQLVRDWYKGEETENANLLRRYKLSCSFAAPIWRGIKNCRTDGGINLSIRFFHTRHAYTARVYIASTDHCNRISDRDDRCHKQQPSILPVRRIMHFNRAESQTSSKLLRELQCNDNG